jgi:hypothetical protein
MTFGLMTDAFHRSRDALKQCLRKDRLWGGLKLYIQEGINTTRKRTNKVSWITLDIEGWRAKGFESPQGHRPSQSAAEDYHWRSMQRRLSPLCAQRIAAHASAILLGRYELCEDEAHSDKNIGYSSAWAHKKRRGGTKPDTIAPHDHAKRGEGACAWRKRGQTEDTIRTKRKGGGRRRTLLLQSRSERAKPLPLPSRPLAHNAVICGFDDGGGCEVDESPRRRERTDVEGGTQL